MSDVRLVAYDTELMRPGCVMVAAGLGADSSIPSMYFEVDDWLLYPTRNMKVYRVTESQLAQLVAKTEAARA